MVHEFRRKLTLNGLTSCLRPVIEPLGFSLWKNDWFVKRVNRNADLGIKLINTRPGGSLNRCDFLINFVDWRQFLLLREWLEPHKQEILERTAAARMRRGYQLGWERSTDLNKWFDPAFSKLRKGKQYTTYMYCFFPPCEAPKSSPTKWHSYWRLMACRYAMDYAGWRLVPRIDEHADDLPERSLAGMASFVRDVIAGQGVKLRLEDFLDDEALVRKAVVRDYGRQHIVGRASSRWEMALDLSAAITLERFDAVPALLNSRKIYAEPSPTELDTHAYSIIVDCACRVANGTMPFVRRAEVDL